MKVKKELIPKLTESRNNKYHITFWFKNKRFRYSSGKIIGLDIQPNMEENSIRKRRAELLRSAFELEIEKGWRPEIKSLKEIQRPSIIQLSQTTLDRKLAMDFSDAYKAVTNPMFEKQNLIGSENQMLEKLRDWLLPMLMNGQVTIKN